MIDAEKQTKRGHSHGILPLRTGYHPRRPDPRNAPSPDPSAAACQLVALPLVLPPTVLGFYLLIALAPNGIIGGMTTQGLAFSFVGLVIGSALYSLPFVVQPLQNAFGSISRLNLEAASTLRASPLDRFFSIVLPLSRPGFITAATLGFAHTVGEFGVVLMIGGNIPGETQVLSIAIYDHVEALEYTQAHWLSGGLLLFSFIILFLVYRQNSRWSHS